MRINEKKKRNVKFVFFLKILANFLPSRFKEFDRKEFKNYQADKQNKNETEYFLGKNLYSLTCKKKSLKN